MDKYGGRVPEDNVLRRISGPNRTGVEEAGRAA
jgi:hypothetical protein